MFLCYSLLFFHILSIISSFNLSPKFSVTINDPSKQTQSFFGFSVHLRSGLGQYTSSIVIGAPQANSSFTAHMHIVEPGVIYQCNINGHIETTPICDPLLLDPTGEVTGNALTKVYKHRKTHAWLGASLDGQNNRGGRLVVCAPRWVNQYHKKEWLNNGLCYWVSDTFDTNRTADKLIPLLDRNLRYFENKVTKRKHYGYIFGEAGFSIHMPNIDGSEILLGAPGVNSWTGSVIWCKDVQNKNSIKNKSTFSKPFKDVLVLNTTYNKRFTFESYFGYSLNSGIFLSGETQKRYFVASAPRDYNYNGKVFLFEIRDTEMFRHQQIRITKEFVGQQMGAPRHSIESNFDDVGDEGDVYVFLNEDYWKFDEQSKLEFAQEIGSQFGTSISALGDLDQDGYNDIVVGAPYENNGKGAIYIYLGSVRGLKQTASQHIKAKNINDDILSFGYSLSRGVDIDSNAYNDLVVGAYQSGSVVLFRSRPVARLKARIIPQVQEISIDTTKFDVRICILYNGYHVPDFINVTLNIFVDSVYKRISVLLKDNSYKSVLTKIVRINYDSEYCEMLLLEIRAQNQDFSKPIGLLMSYSLDNATSKDSHSFCATCPVLDPNSDNFVEIRIPYITGCGNDSKCTPDLKLTAEFLNDIFIIGKDKSVKLNITIENFGEPAFLIRLFLNMSSDLTLVEFPTYCHKVDNGPLICELGNILGKDEKKNVILELDTINIKSDSKFLKINMSVTSMGDEQNEVDNRGNVTLSLLTISQLTITGKSIPEQLQYKNEQNQLKNNKMTISQEYEIRNFGPSPITASLVQFFIPLTYNNMVLLKVSEPETSFEKQSLVCNATDPGFSLINYQSEDFSSSSELQQLKQCNLCTDFKTYSQIENHKIKKRDISTVSTSAFPANRTLFLNCSQSNPLIACMTVTCSIGLLKDSNIGAKIKLSFQVQLENVERVLEGKDITQLDVDAVVTALIKVDSNSGGTATITLGSTLIGSQYSTPIPILWIALAIGFALLIMLLIITALVKLGFFKRNTKEQLELLKEQNEFQGSILPVDLICKENAPVKSNDSD